jgi:thiol-disulfide isomerase/thioredoxin
LKYLRSLVLVGVLAAAVWAVSARPWALSAQDLDPSRLAPEFTHTSAEAWINSVPMKLADLEGRVVLIDFWTYDCWNCRRSVPWIKALASRFGDDGLVVVGVHTPEFKYERDADAVRQHVEELGFDHPVMVDNDFSYWDAMGNRHWPTFYLIDKSGRVRQRTIGEVLPDGDKARELEARITALLGETA